MPFGKMKAHREEMLANGVQMREWEYGLFESCCKNPVGFCYGLICVPCFAYQQRMRILTSVNTTYQPFNGSCGGCCEAFQETIVPGSPGEKCCMCCEFVLCPCCAVIVNRDMITVHYNVAEDKCDEYMVVCLGMCCAIVLICLTKDNQRNRNRDQVRGKTSNTQTHDIAACGELFLLVLMSCMTAQQESTLDVVTGNPTCLGGNFISEQQANFANEQHVIEIGT